MRIPLVIAEAGGCHMGGEERAHQLLNVAVRAGADIVKYQYWSSPERMRARRHVKNTDAYEVGSIHLDWVERLREQAKAKGILLGCSVYLPEDVDVVAKFANILKVSSFEARDRDLTRLLTKYPQPIFVSTGMMSDHELGYLPKRAIRLHCVSAYPCPPAQANLGAIERGQGYSDHTRSEYMGAFAVCAGADYLEVHFRLADTPVSCPDYVVSHDPDGLARYIALARAAAAARGDGHKRPMEVEREMMRYRVVS